MCVLNSWPNCCCSDLHVDLEDGTLLQKHFATTSTVKYPFNGIALQIDTVILKTQLFLLVRLCQSMGCTNIILPLEAVDRRIITA